MSTQRRVRQAYEIKHMSWIRLGTDMEEDACSVADEAQCVIVRGERREVIPLTDANDAQKVKVLFGLDQEPACVFSLKNKRIPFGELKDEVTYNLNGPTKISDQTSHVNNALWLCDAVYKEDPLEMLQETHQKHTIHTVHAISKHSDQGVILACGKVKGKDTLYVAYRGTTTWKDAVTDANIEMEEDPTSFYGGSFHSGFKKRSIDTVRAKDIFHVAKVSKCETIILCGHSLGGAVSSITAVNILDKLPSDSVYKVHNITFGAPFFGNEAVRKYCKTKNLEQHLLHYASVKDIVPGLLSLGHTSRIISEKFPSGLSVLIFVTSANLMQVCLL